MRRRVFQLQYPFSLQLECAILPQFKKFPWQSLPNESAHHFGFAYLAYLYKMFFYKIRAFFSWIKVE